MVTATITTVLDLSRSFYARVGDDYRIYIPKEFREAVERIEPGDMIWVIIGTVIPNPKSDRVIVPGWRR